MIIIKAKIYLYKYNGRKSPFKSGYRPLFNFDNNLKVSGQIDLINEDCFCVGNQGTVHITFLNNTQLENQLCLNKIFSFDEGLNILGEGEVLDIKLPALRRVNNS